jgi:epoxyqueuosine reductase
VAVPGDDLQHPAAAPGRARRGQLRNLQCLPDGVPDRGLPRPLPARCAALHFVPDDRTQGVGARGALGNRIYGCDDCLSVCPWNKFADTARTMRAFLPRAELAAPRLAELLALDDAGFRKLFAGSPIKRIGRDRMVRNCLYAAGNSGDVALVPRVEALLSDPDPAVVDAARWALGLLAP